MPGNILKRLFTVNGVAKVEGFSIRNYDSKYAHIRQNPDGWFYVENLFEDYIYGIKLKSGMIKQINENLNKERLYRKYGSSGYR